MKRLVSFLALLLLPVLAASQGIRKNYTEMTSAEKDAYVSALNSLHNVDPSLDIVRVIADNYWNYYDSIYYHTCERNEYAPFHRMMLWEMENALQSKNPKLTIPYWDWTTTNSTDDPLFTDFLNVENFPAGWHISPRDLGTGGTLPTSEDVAAVQDAPEYCDDGDYGSSYMDRLQNELGTNPELWAGGIMTDEDPMDPLYYLHHAMLDKLWEDWYKTTNLSDPYSFGLDRYDGSTSSVFLSPLPYTEPSFIVDSRWMGIFYASDGEADLDGGYQVTNNYMNPEVFSYPDHIVASAFTVPSGKNALFVSQTNVTLASGFVMDGGHLEIDVGSDYYDDFPLAKTGAHGQKPFAQKSFVKQDRFAIVRSPQGFTARLWLQSPSDIQGYVMGVDGKIAARLAQGDRLESGYHEFQLNVPQAGGGLYYAYFKVGSRIYKQLLPKL